MDHRSDSQPGSTSTQASQPGTKAHVPYLDQLSAAKYMLLTTFKRDGTPVVTPVYVAVVGERAHFLA